MKQTTLKILVPLGNVLRSDKVSFNVTGPEMKVINDLINALESFVNAVNDETIVVAENKGAKDGVENPDAD